ncbi:MFS transporter [Desulfobacula sp.]|uniref:MFS transporter n=1 Tax=Desulfobacula sp. TaxID=2593537 RepID=UPI002613E2CD|nr:MFS transporter [Desulfobacula sp.]
MVSNDQAMERKKQWHYGWVIVFTGMAVLFSCLGLGRFSLGMLLPSMGISLNLNYSQMGFLGTGNFVGYMISVVLAGMVARAIGARWTITLGLILVGGSMVLISQAAGFMGVIALYVATGIGSGLANVPMMGLVSHWFLKSNRGRAAGAMLSGNGIAIVFSGLFIPWVNASVGAQGWRTSWMTIGAISLAIAAVAAFFLRNEPGEKGLTPLGDTETVPIPSGANPKRKSTANKWTMVHLGCIYALFGATYVVYATFIVTAMVNERGFGENTAGSFWAVVGGLSIFSGPLFGWLSDRVGRKMGMMLVYTLFTISYVLVAADLPNLFLYASIGIFGLAVWSIPTIMSAAVGDYAGPVRAVKAFGFITLFFGAGQITGPVVAGFLADVTGTFSMAFWLCGILTGSAVVLTYFLKPPSGS